MAYSRDELRFVYDRSSGRCHLCRKKLAFINYAAFGTRAAWEVDHSYARARGGTDRLNNLLAACITCNRSKGKRITRSVRALNGLKRAPLSRTARLAAKRWNAVGGALLGVIPGAVFGPVGLALGAALGAKVAYQADPDLE